MTALLPIFGFRAANEHPPARNVDGGGTVFDLASLRRGNADRSAAIDEIDLHAYVDARLEAGQRVRIEAELARNAEAGLAAAAYRLLNINLHRLFDRDLPPLAASLEALSRELERRLEVLSPAKARTRFGALATKIAARRRRLDPEAAIGRLADAVHRAPLASVVVVVSFIALVGLAWPLVAGQPASCAERVEALAKWAAKRRAAPELGERLAAAGMLCSTGDPRRAEAELVRLEYERRRFGK